MASILPQPPDPQPADLTTSDLATVACPIDRARRVTAIARKTCTLSPQLAALRRAALIEARATSKLAELARQVGLTPGRICQLVALERPAAEEVPA